MSSFISEILSTISGQQSHLSAQLVFDKVIGFRSVSHGAGATTILYNVAAALSENTKYTVCVVDTHMLYPTLQSLLLRNKANTKDWFDYGTNLDEIVCDTIFSNVKYIGFYKRTVLDILSTKDCRSMVDNLMNTLKNVFDIILVDLSDELTVISSYTAINCNKIFTVVTSEVASKQAFKNSINTAVTLAVPAYKLRNCILNKSVGNAYDGTMLTELADNGFNVCAKIPYSTEIYRYGLMGEKFWGAATRHEDITDANKAIKTILMNILEVTDKNEKYVTNKEILPKEVTQTPESTIMYNQPKPQQVATKQNAQNTTKPVIKETSEQEDFLDDLEDFTEPVEQPKVVKPVSADEKPVQQKTSEVQSQTQQNGTPVVKKIIKKPMRK